MKGLLAFSLAIGLASGAVGFRSSGSSAAVGALHHPVEDEAEAAKGEPPRTDADEVSEHLEEAGVNSEAMHEGMEHAVDGMKKEEGEGEDHEEEDETAASVFALTMIGSTVLLSVTYAGAMTDYKNGAISKYTWLTIDYVVAIFLAVLWYQALCDLLEWFNLGGHGGAFFCLVHAMAWLVTGMAISWLLRAEKHRIALAIFCGVGAHFVSFASMYGVSMLQYQYFSSSYGMCAAGFFCVVLILSAVLGALHVLKTKLGMTASEDWNEQWSDVENDFAAMGVAICWTLLVRYVICGVYHAYPLDFDKDHESHSLPDPSPAQRNAMLAYALAIIPLGVIVFWVLSTFKRGEGQLAERVAMFISAFLSMATAWAFLIWGQWQFYGSKNGESPLGTTPIFGRVTFAMLMSVLAVFTVVVLANVPSGDWFRSRVRLSEAVKADVEQERRVVILAVSMLVGWTWEQALDEGVEVIAEGMLHPLWWKLFLAVGLAALIVPIYANYLKPSAMDSCAGSCDCGASYTCDTVFCRKCGAKRVLRENKTEDEA